MLNLVYFFCKRHNDRTLVLPLAILMCILFGLSVNLLRSYEHVNPNFVNPGINATWQPHVLRDSLKEPMRENSNQQSHVSRDSLKEPMRENSDRQSHVSTGDSFAWQSYVPNVSLAQPLRGKSTLRPCSGKRFDSDGPALDPNINNGYLSVTIKGGFNQQRKGIVNAVVLARILNATLVMPFLEEHAAWNVSLTMDEVFDTNWFIKCLEDDVKIVRSVDQEVVPSFAGSNVPNYLGVEDCISVFLPALLQHRVILVEHWHVQLKENLPLPLQRLRCRVNFHALRFRRQITKIGMGIVQTLQNKGPYIAVHMRFEEDWLRYFRCFYDNSTLTAKPKRGGGREGSFCPFSPIEIAIILKAMGVNSSVTIYLAGGKVADDENSLRPLQKAFVGQVTNKEAIWKGDAKPLERYGAIIDHLVAFHSDILILGGGRSNWGHVVEGERFYSSGHKKETIVLGLRFLQPHLKGDSLSSMDSLATTLRDYRNAYWYTGCRMELGNPSPAFCYPIDCMCGR